MLRADDARRRMKFEEEAFRRLLMPCFLSRDGLVRTRAWMSFAGPTPHEKALSQALSDPERRRITAEWRLLAGRLGLQTVLFERNNLVNRWLDPSLHRVRTWFRSSKGFARARARREALSGAAGRYFYTALAALITHAEQINWTQKLEVDPWRTFVHADEPEVAYWFHRLQSMTAAAHLDQAIIALGDARLRKVPATLRTPVVLQACLASARSSMSLDLGDKDQHTIIERLLTELAKLHPPILDTPETRVHLVRIVEALIRAERFLVEELRWDFLQSENHSIIDLFRAMMLEEVRPSPVDEAA